MSNMSYIFVLKIIPFVVGFSVLLIATFHAIRKPGQTDFTDTLPRNSYSKKGQDDPLV